MTWILPDEFKIHPPSIAVLNLFCSMDPSKSKAFPRTPKVSKGTTNGPSNPYKISFKGYKTFLLYSSWSSKNLSTDPRIKTYALWYLILQCFNKCTLLYLLHILQLVYVCEYFDCSPNGKVCSRILIDGNKMSIEPFKSGDEWR